MIQKRLSRFLLLSITLLLFIGLISQPIQASGIEMKVKIGFDGYVVPERWAPLHVLFNQRMNNADLEVIKIDHDGLSSPVEIFSIINQDHVEIPMYMGLDFKTVKIRLCKDGFCLAEQNINVGEKRFPGHLILAFNITESDEQEIERALQPEEPVLVIPTRFADLPWHALTYDGISRIVMNDPGPVLTPGQSRSLHNWVSLGGRLLIFTNRPLSDSIILSLGYSNVNIEKVDPTIIPAGLGTLEIISSPARPGQTPIISGGRWRQVLDLKSYTREAKMHVSQYIFDHPQHKTKSFNFNFSFYVATVVALWALSGLMLIVLTGFHWREVGLFTMIALILMVPVAGKLRTYWHRGVDAHTWAVILPNQGGAILRSQIWINRQPGKSMQVSPWGAGLSLGKTEYGELGKKGDPSTWWKHQSPHPLYLNQSLDCSSLDLTSWFPDLGLNFPKNNSLATMNFDPVQKISIRDIFRYDHHSWFRLTGYGVWIKASAPEWLDSEIKWKSQIHTLMPDVRFITGRGRLPSSATLNVEGFPLSEVHWIMPLSKSEQ